MKDPFIGVRGREVCRASDGNHHLAVAEYSFPTDGTTALYVEVHETHDAAGPAKLYPLSAAVHVLQNLTDAERWPVEMRAPEEPGGKNES